MEAVKAFNEELSSVQESKGPISRAKMAKITSMAIKAVKFYKHVVHSVEKFIQKCDVEHKIPGLYVMDSIIRQSIHRFGAEKDVFASRFTKNIFNMFQHLLQCKGDDKVKIVRVLQLWQKNSVFSNDLIQKLLDLIDKSSEASSVDTSDSAGATAKTEEVRQTEANASQSSQILNSVSQLLQSDKASQINQLLQEVANNHPQLLPQLSQIIQLSQNQNSPSDALYSEKPNPETLSTSNSFEPLHPAVPSAFESSHNDCMNSSTEMEEGQTPDHSRNFQWMPETLDAQQDRSTGDYYNHYNVHQPDQMQQQQLGENSFIEREEGEVWCDAADMGEYCGPPRSGYYDHWGRDPGMEYEERNYSRKRRRSGDRESNERSRRSRSREKRRRSRSTDRGYRYQSDERSEERQRREMERNKRHLGMPMVEPNHASICSTTIWIGHLNKHTTEQELRTELANYGTITSMNLIPPRGCAYITYSLRKESQKALEKLKGRKFNNNLLKVAWAIGSGMKESEFKEFWSTEQGASFIPWSRLSDGVDLDALAEGGVIDEDSLSEDLKRSLAEKRQASMKEDSPPVEDNSNATSKSVNSEPGPPLLPPGRPPCFPPMHHLPMPLPGLPPILPPPPGLMMTIPPPLVPPGGPPPPMALSPNRNNTVDRTSPSSTGTPSFPDTHIPPPAFPPPMPSWNVPGGMRHPPPPLPFAPPSVPLRPPRMMEPTDMLEAENHPGFPPRPPFGGPMRPPHGPWMFRNRGPPPPRHPYPCNEEYFGDGRPVFEGGPRFGNHGNNRFGPRFGREFDHHSRGRGHWNRGNQKKNFRHWGPNNDGGEQREDAYMEGEGYHHGDVYQNEDHNPEGNHSEFSSHRPQDHRWNKRRWGNGDQGGNGFQRGGGRWHGNNWGRDNNRWTRGGRNQFRGDEGGYCPQEPQGDVRFGEGEEQMGHNFQGGQNMNDNNFYESSPWTEACDGENVCSEETAQTNNLLPERDSAAGVEGSDCSGESQVDPGKRRSKKSRWDDGSDLPPTSEDGGEQGGV